MVCLEIAYRNSDIDKIDDPGRQKVISKRGCKYPERVMNNSIASTSVIFAAAAADGKLLPPYVVYKSTYISDSWRVGGPKHARFNRSKSGWFDSFCFDDCVKTIAIPYLSKVAELHTSHPATRRCLL